jgi:hypothetical protein
MVAAVRGVIESTRRRGVPRLTNAEEGSAADADDEAESHGYQRLSTVNPAVFIR